MKRDALKIDEPCDAAWTDMIGGEEQRFCRSCTKHVHHLSAMSRRNAEKLLKKESSLCVRYAFDNAGRLQFKQRTVSPTAPATQQAGVRRLLAGAAMGASLIAACQWPATAGDSTSAAHASQQGTQNTSWLLAQNANTGESVEPPPHQVVAGGIGPVPVDPQVEIEMGDMPAPPDEPQPLMGEPVGFDPDEVYQQEQEAAEALEEFGIELEEETWQQNQEGDLIQVQGRFAPVHHEEPQK